MKETQWIVGYRDINGDEGELPTLGRYTYRGIMEWCNNWNKLNGHRAYWVVQPK